MMHHGRPSKPPLAHPKRASFQLNTCNSRHLYELRPYLRLDTLGSEPKPNHR